MLCIYNAVLCTAQQVPQFKLRVEALYNQHTSLFRKINIVNLSTVKQNAIQSFLSSIHPLSIPKDV